MLNLIISPNFSNNAAMNWSLVNIQCTSKVCVTASKERMSLRSLSVFSVFLFIQFSACVHSNCLYAWFDCMDACLYAYLYSIFVYVWVVFENSSRFNHNFLNSDFMSCIVSKRVISFCLPRFYTFKEEKKKEEFFSKFYSSRVCFFFI